MTCRFDAVEYMNELEAAGVSQAHAKAHANALQRVFRGLVGKCDLDDLGVRLMREIESGKATAAQKFQELEAKLEKLEERLEKVEARLNIIETRLAALISEMRMHRWALGFLGALQIATFVKVLTL